MKLGVIDLEVIDAGELRKRAERQDLNNLVKARHKVEGKEHEARGIDFPVLHSVNCTNLIGLTGAGWNTQGRQVARTGIGYGCATGIKYVQLPSQLQSGYIVNLLRPQEAPKCSEQVTNAPKRECDADYSSHAMALIAMPRRYLLVASSRTVPNGVLHLLRQPWDSLPSVI
jgi:hypothetical protein